MYTYNNKGGLSGPIALDHDHKTPYGVFVMIIFDSRRVPHITCIFNLTGGDTGNMQQALATDRLPYLYLIIYGKVQAY